MAVYRCEGGSIYSQLYISEKIVQTEKWIKELNQLFGRELEQYRKSQE